MLRQNGTDDEETAPRVTRLRKRLNSVDQDVQFVSETKTKKLESIQVPRKFKKPLKISVEDDVEFVSETIPKNQGVTRSLRKRLNSIDQDVLIVSDTPTKKTLDPISEDKNVTNKKIQSISEKNFESTPTKRMTRRNSILEESERTESPSIRSSTKKTNASILTEENVAQLSESVPARRTRRATSITESEQREGTPIVRRSARRNSITSDDGSVVSNASTLRVTRANRKSVHIPEDVLLEADENEEANEIPGTPQLNLNKSKKHGVATRASSKSPSLSPHISTIVTRSLSKSPCSITSPEKTVTTELNQSKNDSLIKAVLSKSIDCIVSLDDVTKSPDIINLDITETKVQIPNRKTPRKETTKIDTPKNTSLIDLDVVVTKTPTFATPKTKTPAKNEKTPEKQKTPVSSFNKSVSAINSPKCPTPKTKTPLKEIAKNEKTPEKQKTPNASRNVSFDKSITANTGIKYAQTPRSKKNESIYEISDCSKDNSVDIAQNESSIKIKDLNQTDLIIADIVQTVTANIGNDSMSESILPLVISEKEGPNTPLRNKKLDFYNSSTPIVGAGKLNDLEKTPLQPILKKNVSLSSSKKTKSEEKKNKADFSKSWSQSVVNKIEVSKPIDSFGMNKEDDVIKTKSPKKSENEYSDTEFQYSDGEAEENEEEEKNPFMDDEAMECNEDSMDPEERQYMEDHEIVDAGISIGSEDTDVEDDEVESKDSFIVSDDSVELLDGSGDDLSHSLKNGSAKKQRKRIIDNSSSEDEVANEEIKQSPKKTPKKTPSNNLDISQKEKSIKEIAVEEKEEDIEEEEVKDISSDEETKKISDNFNSFLKELNSSHKTVAAAAADDEDEEKDEDFVVPEEDSEAEDVEEEASDEDVSDVEEENYRETVLKKFTGTKANQLNESVKLNKSANKSLNKSVKQISPEVSLLNTTFSKTDDEDEVSGDEKENIALPVEEETTTNTSLKPDILNVSQKLLTKTRKSLNVGRDSPALNKSHKNVLNVSTASASGGFMEENLDVEVMKTPLKRDVAEVSKKVTLSEIKMRCEAILHANEASKKILREQYKVKLQEDGDDKLIIKREKRKQKLEEKQRKAEEKAEILKAFKHSKQLLLEAQIRKKLAEAEANEEHEDDSYEDVSSSYEVIPSPAPQKKKFKKASASNDEVILPPNSKKSKKRPIEDEIPVLIEKKKKKLKQTEQIELPALVEKKKNKKKELEAAQVIDALFHKFDESDSEIIEEPERKKKKKNKTSVSSTSDFNVSVLQKSPQKKKSKLRMLEKLSSNFVEEPITPPKKIQSTFKESPITPKHYNVVNVKSIATKVEKVKKIKTIKKIKEPENVLPMPTWSAGATKKKRVLSLSEESQHMKGFQVEELEPEKPKISSKGYVNTAVEFKKKLMQNTAGRHTTKSLLNNMKKKKFN